MPVPDTSNRPRRADAVRNRAKLVAAARAALAEHGLDVHMEEIARRAGVGVGTLYRHFPTKDALVLGLVDEKFAAMAAEAERLLAAEAEPWPALRDLLRFGAEQHARDRAQAQVYAHLPDAVFQEAATTSGLRTSMGELIARARAAGVVRDDLDVDDVPVVMCGMAGVVEAGHRWERYLELMLDGLQAGATSRTGRDSSP